MVKVSVIVPIYNMEKFIKECLDSLVEQTIDSIELILVNDGSTDKSLDIIKNYSLKHENIIIINQSNGGLASARVAGMLASNGEYFGFVDADDFVDRRMFEKLYRKAYETNSDVVITNYAFYPAKVSTKEKWYKEYQGLVNWNFIERNTQPWNKLVKRDYAERINLMESLLEGSDGAYIRVLLNSDKIESINEELYFYRVGQDSMSSNYKNIQKFIDNISMTENQKKYIEGTKYEESLREYFEYRIIYSIIQALIIAAYNQDKKKYQLIKERLFDLKFRKNAYVRKILRENHGILKMLTFIYMVPLKYLPAKYIATKFLR